MQVLPKRVQIGDKPVARAVFTDVLGLGRTVVAITFSAFAESDPATLVTRDQAHADVEEEATNIWTFALPVITVPGIWWVRVAATSVLVASEETFFEVEESHF